MGIRALCVCHTVVIQMKVLDTSLRQKIAKALESSVMQRWMPHGYIQPFQDCETSRLNNSLHSSAVLGLYFINYLSIKAQIQHMN